MGINGMLAQSCGAMWFGAKKWTAQHATAGIG